MTFTRDARSGCAAVLEIGVQVAVRIGFRVIACADPISTPQGYFLTLRTSARHPKTMGLAITASHNPAQYIGVKFTVPTVQAIGLDCGPLGGLSKVREIYHSANRVQPTAGGELYLLEPPDQGVRRLLARGGRREAGRAGRAHRRARCLSRLGRPGDLARPASRRREVVPLRLVPNGEFPTGSPNPTSQGKMDRRDPRRAARKGRRGARHRRRRRPRSSSATAAASSPPASSRCRSSARCSTAAH